MFSTKIKHVRLEGLYPENTAFVVLEIKNRKHMVIVLRNEIFNYVSARSLVGVN